MLGTLVNALAILVGGALGLFIKGGIPERVNKTIMNGLALCVLYIGISGTLKIDNPLIMIISIVIGAVIGEIIDIDRRLDLLGKWIESKVSKGNSKSKISEGFVTSTLLFCVGAMAIVGSIEGGLKGEYGTLFAKSALDGVSSILFATTLGIGVLFSAIAVFIYQGAITIGASFLVNILSTVVINNITAVGSLMIIGLGFNMLGVTKIKVANLLPGIIIPIILSYII